MAMTPRRVVGDAKRWKAMSHPLRREMLRHLGQHGPATSTTIAEALGENTGTTSYHLRVLADAGVIDAEGSAPLRPGRRRLLADRAAERRVRSVGPHHRAGAEPPGGGHRLRRRRRLRGLLRQQAESRLRLGRRPRRVEHPGHEEGECEDNVSEHVPRHALDRTQRDHERILT